MVHSFSYSLLLVVLEFYFLKISLWEYNLYKNKNNQKPYMISKIQRCKMIALLKSLKILMYSYFGFTFQNPSSRIKSFIGYKPEMYVCTYECMYYVCMYT